MAEKLKIIPLGGLDEIGKNCTVLEYGKDMIVIDCGVGFPEEDMYGVDLVIPDFTYLVANQKKLRGMFITHGHEDHIGSIPYAMRDVNCPIHGTSMTCGLIKLKLEEHRLADKVKLVTHKPGDVVKAGCFTVEFIHVNHSIPDAVAFAIRTPVGTVVFTGDFKIDPTSHDGMMDLARLGELGNQGVLAMLADSTNVERQGYTPSENVVADSLDRQFRAGSGQQIGQQEVSERDAHLLRVDLRDKRIQNFQHLDLEAFNLRHVGAERGDMALHILFQHDHAGKIRIALAEHFADGLCDGVRRGVDCLIARKLADIRRQMQFHEQNQPRQHKQRNDQQQSSASSFFPAHLHTPPA